MGTLISLWKKNRYVRAHTVLYLKNGSQIEIFSFLQLLTKMLNYSIYKALRSPVTFCLSPAGQSICLSPGGETFLTHRRGGGKHFCNEGGQTFLHWRGAGILSWRWRWLLWCWSCWREGCKMWRKWKQTFLWAKWTSSLQELEFIGASRVLKF